MAETDSNGISMKVFGNLLVTVSNCAVTAYKLTDPPGATAPVPAAK